MGVRSRTRQRRPRRRRGRGTFGGAFAFMLFLAAAAALVWLAWSRRKPPTIDDQMVEMIRENPAAEVLAPVPGQTSRPGAGPEVLQMGVPSPDPNARKRGSARASSEKR